MEKTGRNDPCPCGSGKKYKKCCLNQDQAAGLPAGSRHDHCVDVLNSLEERIIAFGTRSVPELDLESATGTFADLTDNGEHSDQSMEQDSMLLKDWLIYDYLPPGLLKPLNRLFWESKPKLPAEEMTALEENQNSRVSAFHILKTEPGLGARLKDMFSGREVFVNDIAIARQSGPGDMLITRILAAMEEYQPSSLFVRGESRRKRDFMALVEEHFTDYQKECPGADMKAFLKARGIILPRLLAEVYSQNNSMPKMKTTSGEDIEFHEAHYDLLDRDGVLARLDRAVDFDRLEQRSPILYAWQEAGESAELIRQMGAQTAGAFKAVQRSMFGKEDAVRSLGCVTIKGKRLVLESVGKGRMQAGKKRLDNLLGGLVRHRLDSIRSLASALAQEGGELEPPGPPASNQAAEFTLPKPGQSIQEALGGREFESIDEANAFLQHAAEDYNHRPQPEMGGLSPFQVRRLLDCGWEDEYGPMRINPSLSIAHLQGADFLDRAAFLLQACYEMGGVKATKAGYLNTSFVLTMAAAMTTEDDGEREAFMEAVRGRIKERDVFALHLTRIVCQAAGLMELKKNRFVVSRACESLLDDQKAGMLYARLFFAYFQKLDLDSLSHDGCSYPGIQQTMVYSLYMLGSLADGRWRSMRDLCPRLLLPSAKRDVGGSEDFSEWDEDSWLRVMDALDYRLVQPLASFGLLEEQQTDHAAAEDLDSFQIRPTRLFKEFISFYLD